MIDGLIKVAGSLFIGGIGLCMIVAALLVIVVIGKELFCHKSGNITFLATGLGGEIVEGEAGRSKHYLIIDSINQIIKIRVRVI